MDGKGYFRKACYVPASQCRLWAKSLELSPIFKSVQACFYTNGSGRRQRGFVLFFLHLLFLSCLKSGIFWRNIF